MRRHNLSLRLRLTLSYGVVFFVVGFVLIAVSYVLVRQVLIHDPGEFLDRIARALGLSRTYLDQQMPAPGGGQQTIAEFMRTVQDRIVSQLLHGLTIVAFQALAIAAAVSVGLGWLIAGRMLRPLGEIAVAARHASASTLHERIALQGPRDELRSLADTFDDMLARLETAFVAQREFVANASHELRTPLAIMRTELDVTLADSHATTDDLRRMAETIRTAIARSDEIVDGLLVLAESENIVERAPVDLGDLAGTVVRRHERGAADRGLSFAADLEPTVVEGDRVLLERLADNLVDNAVRYAAVGSVVRFEVTSGEEGVTLRVANAGETIGPEELPRLFERFYRRDASRSRNSGGAGLGMAIVAAVTDVHGGTVSAEGPADGGLIVTVVLPSPAAAEPARDADSTRVRRVRPTG